MKDFCGFYYIFMNDFCSSLYTLHSTTEHAIFRLVQSVHHLDDGFHDRDVVGFAL
jgi:energy-converting hydrogenase A subunit M